MSSGQATRLDQLQRSVSVVVVSYFTGPLLSRCLQSLHEQLDVVEIILVDNGNLPGAIESAVESAPGAIPVRILSGHGNIGFAAACNKGAETAQSGYILIFNPDAVMPEGGVEQMLEDAKELERPWLMGARLIGPDGDEQQGSRRNHLTPITAILEASRLSRLLPHDHRLRFNLHDAPAPDSLIEMPTLSGACMLLPRADYHKIGGMDAGYFLHVEDIDFCRRFGGAGGQILFNPNVAVTHFKGSSRTSPARVERLKTESMIRYFKIHFADMYPAPILWLLSMLLWIFFSLRMIAWHASRSFRILRFFLRRGRSGLRRARRIHVGCSSR